MSEVEKKAKLKSLIEEYEICYKESKYEGNVEEYKSLKETHKLLKDILNLIDKLQGDVKLYKNQVDYIKNEYGTTIEELQKENKELKEDNSHQWEERCRLTFELDKLQKEIERIKSIDIHKLVEDAETGQLIHKDKIRNKIKELTIDYHMYMGGIMELRELLGDDINEI